MEFEPDKEDIVWCKAACGNNIHKVCFDKWAATQRAQGVRCVYWCVLSLLFPLVYLFLSRFVS